MISTEVKLIYRLLREVNEASKALQFHKQKGAKLNQRIQLIRPKLESILQEPQPQRYLSALSSLQLHLKSAHTVFQECGKGKLYRILNYKRIMQDIVEVNVEITQALIDIQFIQPKDDTAAMLMEFLQGGLDVPEVQDDAGDHVELEKRDPSSVVQAIASLRQEGRVSAADVAGYRRDLEELRGQNEEMQQLVAAMGDHQQSLAVRKSAAEDVILNQLIAMLGHLDLGKLEEHEVEVPADFRCPIGLDVMCDPVILVDTGMSFEREHIDEWFRIGKRTCPSTNQTLTSTAYIPNIALRNAIEDWATRHGSQLSTASPTSTLSSGNHSDTSRGKASVSPSHVATQSNELSLTELKAMAARGSVDAQTQLAELGHVDAQYELGLRFANGTGVPLDFAKAAAWFRRVAEEGDARGQYNLGLCYKNGTGVLQDGAEATLWLERAADQGVAAAECELGCSYYYGEGVPEDLAQGAAWWQKAAEQGYARAQQVLGGCYALGLGVVKDEVLALQWARKAIEQGSMRAKVDLGELLLEGFANGPNDWVEAVLLYESVVNESEGEEVIGAIMLAWLLWTGVNGVKKDRPRARILCEAVRNIEDYQETIEQEVAVGWTWPAASMWFESCK